MKPLLERVENRLKASWHGHAAESMCLSIIHYLDQNNVRENDTLTLTDIVKITGKEHLDNDVVSALAILSNFPEEVLRKRFLYVDESDESVLHLEKDQIADLIRRGDFYHPELNKRISQDFVVPIFEVNEALKDHDDHA